MCYVIQEDDDDDDDDDDDNLLDEVMDFGDLQETNEPLAVPNNDRHDRQDRPFASFSAPANPQQTYPNAANANVNANVAPGMNEPTTSNAGMTAKKDGKTRSGPKKGFATKSSSRGANRDPEEERQTKALEEMVDVVKGVVNSREGNTANSQWCSVIQGRVNRMDAEV